MSMTIIQRCELFLENRDMMAENFKFSSNMLNTLCASIYSEKKLVIDIEKIKACIKIIKNNTNIFSNFRGSVRNVYAVKLSLMDNPEKKFKNILEVYSMLKVDFAVSEFLPMAAFLIVELAEEMYYESVVKRAYKMYRAMKKNHPFLTASEDCGFAVILALTVVDEEVMIDEMEECYHILKKHFGFCNALQSLTHILVLKDEKAEDKCREVRAVIDKFKESNCTMGKGMELLMVGLIAMLCEHDNTQVIHDVIEANEYLRMYKGFNSFGIGNAQRMLYAGIMSINKHQDETEYDIEEFLISDIPSFAILEQAVVAAVIADNADSASTGL